MEARTGRRTVSTGTGVDAAPELTVPVTGMTCTSCERRVTKALLAVPGRAPERATGYDLGFIAGPRLTAAGRLADMSVDLA